MKYDPKIHHRKSIRLQGYDYSQPGAYFVTICAQDKKCLFGEIIENEMHANPAGEMIEKWFRGLSNKFFGIEYDEFVCMPNHVHFIVIKNAWESNNPVRAGLCACPGSEQQKEGQTRRSARTDANANMGSNLSSVVQWFKTMTTNEYIRQVNTNDWERFDKRLWHRNYYEHVVRNENELNLTRQYIIDNPQNWETDEENPNLDFQSTVQ